MIDFATLSLKNENLLPFGRKKIAKLIGVKYNLIISPRNIIFVNVKFI